MEMNRTVRGLEGEPLPLVEFIRDPESTLLSIKLVDGTLTSIHQRTGSRPLSIVCICGSSRQEKSVLFGYLIRYLTALETNETDWFGWNEKEKPSHGFQGRNGSKQETQGIWVWSRPFIVKTEEGKEVAILLINSQGCHGDISRVIIGLSVLTSSIMIFNCSSTTQDELFESLQTYRQYGNLASEAWNYKKTFQKLLFLICDWKNLDEFPYGPQGGKRYLFKTLNAKTGDSQVSPIQDCVEDIQCFLMPYIGEKGASSDFQGSVGELEPKFAQKLEQLIVSLLSPEEIVAKEILGWCITADDLKKILQMYLEIFNSKEKVSGTVLLEKTCRFHSERVLEKALAKFADIIKRKMKGRSYLGEDEIDGIFNLGEQVATEFFQKESKFSTKTESIRFKEELHVCIKREKDALKICNEKSRNSYIHKVTEDTVAGFRSSLDSNFPFDEEQFYEDATIQRAITQAKDQVLEDFKDKLDNESGDRLTESVKALETGLDKVTSHIVDRNNALRTEAAELFESWFWKLKDEVGTAVEGKSSRAVSEILGRLDSVIPLALQDKRIENPVQNATGASRNLPGNRCFTKATLEQMKPEKEVETQLNAHDNSYPCEDRNLKKDDEQKQLRRESRSISERLEKPKKQTLSKREEEVKRQKAEEEKILTATVTKASSQINQLLVPSIYNFIDQHLNLATVHNFGTIYFDVLKPVVENLAVSVPTSHRQELRIQTHAICKEPAMELLDTISRNVLEFNRGIRKKFDMLGYFDPGKLKVILEEERQKVIEQKFENEEILGLIARACTRIGRIYYKHNGIIKDHERDLHQNLKLQLITFYYEQMKRYMANAPFNPNKLAEIHMKLSDKLVDALKIACDLNGNVVGEVGPTLASLKDELTKVFKLHQRSNEVKLKKLQLEVTKIAEKLKSEFYSKCRGIFAKYPDGVDAKTLGKLHEAICTEIKKRLEIEIRNKIRKDEPVECHAMLLQHHMDSHWITVVNANQMNLIRKSQERVKQAERDRLKEQARLQLVEKGNKLGFDRGHRPTK